MEEAPPELGVRPATLMNAMDSRDLGLHALAAQRHILSLAQQAISFPLSY
jgi:hypothetical protein